MKGKKMSLIDDASRALAPHTRHLTGTISHHAAKLEERLDELKQSSDLGRPDTDDQFKYLIVNKKLPAERQSFDELAGGYDDGGPTLGEIWLIQTICVNGEVNKSPGFVLRTNTGRLILAVKKEFTGSENPGGNSVLLQGEVLFFEPLEEGVFDFTVNVVQRKFPRQHPDAGHGISEALRDSFASF